jgi:DNA primase
MSRFEESFLDELKARVRPSDFIGKTVKLRRAGNEFVGLSPFNKEKTPSFYVNDEKGQFFDFSSGKNGDLISFLQETERLTFVEAVERLAGEAGLALPAADPRNAAQEKVRQGLADWLEVAAQWFEAELRRPAGRTTLKDYQGRGLPASEWGRFRLGFAPAGRTTLKDYLVTKGARPPELVESGLLIAPDDGAAPYDRLRDRIIFPITDARDRVVSFGGRAMDPNARAKYLNGPETPVFHKGHHLYGQAAARKALAADRDLTLVVVEGYMDVIACQRAGIPAMASMGTALGEDQMTILWRHHPEPTLSFDADRAGRQAAERVMDRALPMLRPGRSFRFAFVEGGKDPDQVLREQGADALKAQLARATPFAEALFARELAAAPLDTPEGRVALRNRLRKLASTITDPDLAAAYRDDLFARNEARWQASRPVYAPRGPGGRPAAPAATPAGRTAARALRLSPRPLAAALALAATRDPSLIDDRIEQIGSLGFGDDKLDGLAQALVRLRCGAEDVAFAPEILTLLELDAGRAGVSAPFLNAAGERARELWRQAFDLIMRLGGLERAVAAAAGGLNGSSLSDLKAERDALRKLLNTDWSVAQ